MSVVMVDPLTQGNITNGYYPCGPGNGELYANSSLENFTVGSFYVCGFQQGMAVQQKSGTRITTVNLLLMLLCFFGAVSASG